MKLSTENVQCKSSVFEFYFFFGNIGPSLPQLYMKFGSNQVKCVTSHPAKNEHVT